MRNPNSNFASSDVTTAGDISEREKQQTTNVPAATSERQRQANRLNSQKSTGPKTARGKKYSSRNAVKHGLLANRVLYDEKGELRSESLRALQQQLIEEYGDDGVRTQILIECVIIEYARSVAAAAFEQHLFQKRQTAFSEYLDRVHRYASSNRKTLLADLAALDQLRESCPAEDKESDSGEERHEGPDNPIEAQPGMPNAELAGTTADAEPGSSGSHNCEGSGDWSSIADPTSRIMEDEAPEDECGMQSQPSRQGETQISYESSL